MDEREDARDAANAPGWFVGEPGYHDAHGQWLLYAFDPSEKAVVGVRRSTSLSREHGGRGIAVAVHW